VAGEDVPVYVSPLDFLGKRTALFGMTRTGKSNTVKKIVQATVDISKSGVAVGDDALEGVGQIVFDVNGEYANQNQQDEGTAIFAQYPDEVTRYSVLEKPGFKVMKLNFYKSVIDGFGMLATLLGDDTANYTRAFCNIDWSEPAPGDVGAKTRYDRKVAAYRACLKRAGFAVPTARRFALRTTPTSGRLVSLVWMGSNPKRGSHSTTRSLGLVRRGRTIKILLDPSVTTRRNTVVASGLTRISKRSCGS
jgi:hypothetical protein